VHEHLSDAELARFAADPYSVSTERRQAIEQECAVCSICRTSLDFFSVIDLEDLAEVRLQEPEDQMRAYVERIAAEDREADELLAERKFLSSPMKAAFTDVQRDKQLLTGGVVRRLCAHANSIYEAEPLDALTFADTAIVIAEALPDTAYPWEAVFELRGTAWKERANALMVLGKYPDALNALKSAERAYRHLQSPGFGLSTVSLVRASVFYEQGLLDEAVALAEKAEHGFAHIGQEERRMRALFLRASIKYESRDLSNAIALFEQVLAHGEMANSAQWTARASYAIGSCEIYRGNLAEASLHFHRALMIFREIGPDRDRIATDYGLARILLHGGRREEAIQRLRTVAVEYEGRSMISDAALVRLDIVEVLLAAGQTKQVVEIAARLFQIFKDAGMITSELTAIAYMKEAAAAGNLTALGVEAVRNHLRRAQRQPELEFEPPSEPSR